MGQTIDGKRFVYTFLANEGTKNMNANGSVTPQVYKWTATTDTLIRSVHFTQKDTGIEGDKFGGLAALSTGCLFKHH